MIAVKMLACIFSIINAATGLPATVLVREREQQCFYQIAGDRSSFTVEVSVFYGGSLDIGLTVSCLSEENEQIRFVFDKWQSKISPNGIVACRPCKKHAFAL